MTRLLKNRLALSTVITTLIILVVSILLASVLVYFATNVVSTRVQEESLYVSKQHIWVDIGGAAQGAIMVTNIGGRDVVISKIAVRGQTSAWTNVFYLMATSGDIGLTADLPHLNAVAAGTVAGFANPLGATSGNLVLPSGSTIVIYVNSPDSVGLNDIGLTVSIAVHSAQAVYYSETNIQAIP
jgi:heme/copper-type cytochrome/quinol oxidase subunit 2